MQHTGERHRNPASHRRKPGVWSQAEPYHRQQHREQQRQLHFLERQPGRPRHGVSVLRHFSAEGRWPATRNLLRATLLQSTMYDFSITFHIS